MKLKEVLKLNTKDQQDVFWNIKVVKSLDSFRYRFKRYNYIPLGDHSYKEADYIKRLFFEDDMESLIKGVQECFKLPLNSLMNTNIVTVLKCLKTIKNDIERDIADQNKLSFFSDKKVDMAMKMSKSEVMNQFGLYNVIETLSKGEKRNWDYFLNLKYSDIKIMVAFNAMSGDLNKRFQKNYEQLNKIS